MFGTLFLRGQRTNAFITTALYVFAKDLLEVIVMLGLSSALAVVTVSQWEGCYNNQANASCCARQMCF